eukprot:m.1261943 g.1261943  ORF g.1261943 m.1261943 type:complete len:77 (+) comp24733_c0_seq29:2677-2907(+)
MLILKHGARFCNGNQNVSTIRVILSCSSDTSCGDATRYKVSFSTRTALHPLLLDLDQYKMYVISLDNTSQRWKVRS